MSANYCNCPDCRTVNCPAGEPSQPDGYAHCAVAPGSAIPAISSAYLNIGTARSDALMAEDAWEKENWPDALMWINEAINQLQSARSKITEHAALPNIKVTNDGANKTL